MQLPKASTYSDFRSLVALSHEINRSGKIHCPFHPDAEPSCHIYQNGYKCFGCGSYGDAVDWLTHVQGVPKYRAIRMLKGNNPFTRKSTKRTRAKKQPVFHPISNEDFWIYLECLSKTNELPEALIGKGFSFKDSQQLGLANQQKDALLPITGPDGTTLLAIKKRFFKPNPNRYNYLSIGQGSPAWCSADISQNPNLLIIEGELNGMISWLAFQEAKAGISIMAPAGASGSLYLDALKNKQIFIYADDDEAGIKAKQRWMHQAYKAGAQQAQTLPSFKQDACDIAQSAGRLHLAALYLNAIHQTKKHRKAAHDVHAA